jgi:hypothetical protein
VKGPTVVEQELEALRRFFILRYGEEAAYRSPQADDFPLLRGHRLDLALVNGAERAHFVYQRGDGGRQHLVVIHHLTLGASGVSEEDERRLVSRGIGADETLAHFILRPPFIERFDLVEEQAVAAAERHARAASRPGIDG